MLSTLSIRNVVLIESLDLEFGSGLSVLSGETGAGKSILLDSLGLALGERADTALVRQGAEQASVSAAFEDVSDDIINVLNEYGLEAPAAGEGLVIKRIVSSDGRSRAFVNGEPSTVGALRAIGERLAEVHGQFESQRLLNPAAHRSLLDAYGGLDPQAKKVANSWKVWRACVKAVREAEERYEKVRLEEDFLRHAVEEIGALAPQSGEETELAENRTVMMNGEKIIEAMNAATKELNHGRGVEYSLQNAAKQLARLAEKVEGRLEPIIASLDRASAEVGEAMVGLDRLSADTDLNPANLEQVEERLFALRAVARKHNVTVDALAELHESFERELASIEDGGAEIGRLKQAANVARDSYCEAAEALNQARMKSAKAMAVAVSGELEPLKLGAAKFVVSVDRQDESEWNENGLDRVAFLVATNPGTDPGPIAKIASGGELARFVLALKVILAQADPVATIVFDEVDSGIGGATAAAVGDRLAALASDDVQVLVVTHSPQVASMGARHWRVSKGVHGTSDNVTTHVSELSIELRQEEIARMLSGAEITNEARAAAQQLLGQGTTRVAAGSAA
ncbi:MAG: DNA repair protein RecN [Rhodospirillales bacterium]|nr:DNA repair protein RecN [Rhodospirillales bacterium]